MDGYFLNSVNFAKFWTIFGQFSFSSKKKLIFLTKKKKKYFMTFYPAKYVFLMKNFFQTICDSFWTIFGQFFFSNCAISCDIIVVIKTPGGIQGQPGGFKGVPGIQGRPIVGYLVDLREPGVVPVDLNYIMPLF